MTLKHYIPLSVIFMYGVSLHAMDDTQKLNVALLELNKQWEAALELIISRECIDPQVRTAQWVKNVISWDNQASKAIIKEE